MDSKMVVGDRLAVVSGQWSVVSEEGPGAGGQGPKNSAAPNRSTRIQNRQSKIQNRAAFTLTELLVVIAIIAMLAALVSVGVMRALDSAKQTRIKVEVDNLDAAFKGYKEKYGSYPPCALYTPATNQALRAHIARAFPRYNLGNLANDLAKAGLDPNYTRPDQALVFWLRGFGPDVTNPFLTGAVPAPGVKVARTPFFDFDKARLKNLNPSGAVNAMSYVPPGVKNNAPYLYFETGAFSPTYAAPYSFDAASYLFDPVSGGKIVSAGVATVYCRDVDNNNTAAFPPDEWMNLESYQIVSSGMDGIYGNSAAAASWHLYPAGIGYSPDLSEDDNVTNFCDKARLGDAKP